MLYVAQTALELGFQYALVAMALFLSYRVLDIADMTTDGCFVLGCAVSVTLTAAGHPFLAIPAAMICGAAAGFITAFLQTKLGVPSILAGIITNTGLYTVNLMAMGWKSNASLLKQDTIFSLFRNTGIGGSWYAILLSAGITILMGAILVLFLGTRLGLSIRATGDNKDMVSASSINPAFTTTVGLCLANAIISLSGGLLAQQQKFSDSNLGTGMVVVGLASLIIGEVIVGRGGVARCVAGVMVGSILYRIIMAFALGANLGASNLKLVSAVIVGVTISLPALKSALAFARRKREAKKSC